jgi:hypothetical protein
MLFGKVGQMELRISGHFAQQSIISFSVATMKAHKREAFPAWGEDTSEDFNQA